MEATLKQCEKHAQQKHSFHLVCASGTSCSIVHKCPWKPP
jgi:hypothetical protein